MNPLRLLPRVAAAAILLPSLAFVAEEGSFDRSLSVSGEVKLDVGTGSGSIEITKGASGTVEIHGLIRARSGFLSGANASEKIRRIEENPPIEQTGNVIRVGARGDGDDDLYDNVSLSYQIVVPEDTAVIAKSGSGSQTISGVEGPVQARAGSGSLSLGPIGGDVEARAGSGSIRVNDVGGNLDVKTGSGSIDALAVKGAITASAGSGRIELEQTGAGDVSVHSGSGAVRVRGVRGGLSATTSSGSIRAQGEMVRDWRLEASSGGITVELPPEAAFELDASTGSGSIDSERPVSVTGRISRKSLRGAVGTGGPRLEIETSSGSIVIR
ncbi:MAG TPA: DUF4097 family beta strand repeat-containing protein [Vicinamibacteria bacterium]|nr:DUF4097 family beta strand repeat-containing protein [Vicinamibacteria bacterium]